MGSGRRAGGFTLIELLVVIIIIGILAAITLVVGQGVVQGQRSRLTADTIRVVDIGIDAYFRDVGGPPPVLVEAPNPEPGFATDPTQTVLLPMADATDWTDGASENEKATINSMGVFLEAASQAGLGELVQSVSPDLVTFFDGDDPDNNYSPPAGLPSFGNRQPELRTVLDPWGRPLRFVHPRFDGLITEDGEIPGMQVDYRGAMASKPLVTVSDLPSGFVASDLLTRNPIEFIRRNRITDDLRENSPELIGDSDGGICPGGRPYVYSAGPDGDPSTTDDNVYTNLPTFSAD